MIRALLDATPHPPTDAAQLLEVFEAMHATRQQILNGLTAPIVLATPEDRALADELVERQAAWAIALALAASAIRGQRGNAAKLRRGYGSRTPESRR